MPGPPDAGTPVPASAPLGSFTSMVGSFMSGRNDNGQKTDEGTKPT
jgi:hypothetical protein